MEEEQLKTLSRKNLQQLAKARGIKANKKNAELIKELLEYTKEEKPNSIEVEYGEITENNIETDSTKTEELPAKCNTTGVTNPRLTSSPENTDKAMEKKIPARRETKIPKLAGGIKKERKRDWSKIHDKSFGRMESIDDYIKKKQERASKLKFSLKTVAKDALDVLSTMKMTHNTPKTPKPEVPSSSKKVAYQKATPKYSFQNKTHNLSIQNATPKSGCRTIKAKVDSWHTERTVSRKTMFDFRSPSRNTKFDLKESLKKPLGYKPHTGKLRTLGQTYVNKKENIERRHVGVKDMKGAVDRRIERRACTKENRSNAKSKMLQKRRGIVD
eukprot:Seg1160.14 transcript_id=Seg1160.14/GoldUCD/mRNA.D3Y31 product="Nucleolar and spindle-associated protein 1" protein_id=Seg1160.14/GoldUCD/D3Y31